jgi:hypothetical protein
MAGEYPFRLNPVAAGRGISCDARGCYAGRVPLLERRRNSRGQELWTARPQADLDDAMSARYGHPVDMSAKLGGLSAIADALNRGDVFRAQLGTLALRLPDPPESAPGADPWRLAALLHGSDMLRRGQNSSPPTHDCQSGTCGSSAGGRTSAQQYARDPRVIPAQEFLFSEIPFELPGTRPIPPLLPWDFARPRPGPIPPDMPRPWQGPLQPEMPLNPPWARPGPVRPDMPWYGPNYYQRRDGATPTPGEPEDADCKQIRAEAEERCTKELDGPQFGRAYPYRDIEHCMDSEVPERCGGHHYERFPPRRPWKPPLSA